jgi:hypothetical protein
MLVAQHILLSGVAVNQHITHPLGVAHRRLELGPVPVVVVADQQGQIAACDGFLDEFGLLDAAGFCGIGRKREQQEGKRQQELAG